MAERIDIERALEKLVSDEAGPKFQSLAVVLAKLRWKELIACERHNDMGLDAYAPVSVSPDGRGKGLACSTTGTFDKVRSDAEKVQNNYRDVSLLVFYTTKKVTQSTKAKWAQKIHEKFGYELIVVSREEIIASLQLPDNAQLCRTHLDIAVPYQPDITDLLAQVRVAAAVVAAEWAAHPRLSGRPSIALNAVALDRSGGDTPQVASTRHLRTLLLQGRRIVLEAPAGRGKTTTLVQLAQADASAHGIPILIDLASWVRSGKDILEYVAASPAFRARRIDADALSRLPQAEPYLFLLNGWNEIAEIHTQPAGDALRALERAFPKAGIIVATRTHHIIPPVPGAARFRLLPLTPDQRSRYLLEALSEGPARELNLILSRDPVLDDLTRTPFVLSEVTTLFRSKTEIPSTKLGLLGAVITLNENTEEHASSLQRAPLRGLAEHYLRALATHLNARGDVLLAEPDARSICHGVGDALRSAGQIADSPEPYEILNALTAHHVLERVDYPGISFRFEHQQFQEYYAALTLRDLLRQVVASGDLVQADAFARNFINDPSWDEPLRMVAGDLGSTQADIAAGKLLVELSLRVDPVFAARLSYMGGHALWKEVRGPIHTRLRALYAVANPQYRQCALTAMLATGSDEFSDIVMPLLTNADHQVRLGTYRAGMPFHPSTIGPKWQNIVAGWTEEQRGEFVTELTMHQGRIEVALTFARTDPSLVVRLAALHSLSWMGQYDSVGEILQSLPDPESAQALQKFHTDEIPPPLRARAVAAYKALLSGTADPKARLQITLALAELNDADTPERLKAELNAMPAALVRELSDYALRPAVEILHASDPEWLSQWVIARTIEGGLWRDNWISLITQIPTPLKEQLLQRACTEDLRSGRGGGGGGVIALLEAAADPDLGRAVFIAYRDHHRALIADPQNQQKQAIDGQLRSLLRLMPRTVIIEGLSDTLAQPPQDDDLAIITELFGLKGADNEEADDTLPDALRERLRVYLKAAVRGVVAEDDFRGQQKGYLSAALAEIGDSSDMADVVDMIRADIDRLREGRTAILRGDRSARARGNPMYWSGWHVEALVQLGYRQSEAILLGLLTEPEYEVDAAWALQVIARNDEPSRTAIRAARFGQTPRDFRKIRGSASQWRSAFQEDLRAKCAAAIRQRILDLLDESKTGDHKTVAYHYRLKELAKVLAALDPVDSADLILQIAELPARSDGWHRVALLEALVFAGVALPADRAMAILSPVLDEFRAHGIYSNNGALLTRMLSLLPFVDPPARGVTHIRDLFAEFRLFWYAQCDLFFALGRCADEAGLALLCEVAGQNEAGFQNVAKEWIESIASSPSPRATEILLGFVDPDVRGCGADQVLPDYALDSLAGRLTDLARADSAIAERMITLSMLPLSPQQCVLLAKVLAWLGSTQSLLAGLNLIDDASPRSTPYEIYRAIEDLFLEKRAYGENSQSFTRVPRAANDLKARLFEMARHDPKRAKAAYSLLGQIEEWRLEYGRPPSEPRHPALESGDMWPPIEPPTPPDAAGTDQNAIQTN